MVLEINKIAKPGQRNFTIKSLARGFCGHRPSPAKPKRRPPRISRRKITKVRLWLRELLLRTRRKISCWDFHLFWEKMHAISYSLFHWSEREISVEVSLSSHSSSSDLHVPCGPHGSRLSRRATTSKSRKIRILHFQKDGKRTAKGRQKDGSAWQKTRRS